ncbi:protein of unknown function [Methylorubrum extorquens DM4]|uniref:Uncharacterized protein n=1 Tax=Methylorubrum extorquens (strain DSM 6343 / CIP 106787 / DM4) TaxID=661410 RepID=C7CCS4_METED|nr:protein of unknown function [Methylorubrum extorquens DM4]
MLTRAALAATQSGAKPGMRTGNASNAGPPGGGWGSKCPRAPYISRIPLLCEAGFPG